MCFSATASFSAGAALAVIGTVSLTKANKPSQKLFAGLPLLFAAQQITEGVLWLSLSHDNYSQYKTLTSYIFLTFAQVLWPTLIPLSLYLLEHNALRKKFLRLITFIGVCCSLILMYRLIAYDTYVGIEHHHVRYEIGTTPFMSALTNVLYVVTILFPFFISSVKKITFLGILLLISLLVTKFFYADYLISVWCFFAAVLSLTIIYVVSLIHKEQRQEQDDFRSSSFR